MKYFCLQAPARPTFRCVHSPNGIRFGELLLEVGQTPLVLIGTELGDLYRIAGPD